MNKIYIVAASHSCNVVVAESEDKAVEYSESLYKSNEDLAVKFLGYSNEPLKTMILKDY